MVNQSYFKRQKWLIKAKFDFKMIKTTNTTVLKYLHVKEVFSASQIELKYMYLFTEIKKEASKNIAKKYGDYLPDYRGQLLYFKFRAQEEAPKAGEAKIFKNCLEIDINKAYYKAALNLGIITESYYNKYINLPKDVRLKLIGAIATRKQIFNYKNGKLESIEEETNQLLRKAWFMIVNEVDSALYYFAEKLGENFIFYWVDGIYIKKFEGYEDIKNEVSNLFKFEFSVDEIKEITLEKGKGKTTKVKVKTEEKTKFFITQNLFLHTKI